MQNQSVQDILMWVSQIDSTLDSVSQDKSRLMYIRELVNSWWIEYAEKVVQELCFETSKQEAYSIISWKNNWTSIYDDSYLRVAEKQNNHQIVTPKPLKRSKVRNLPDSERYEEIISYIESNKNEMTKSKIYQTKKKISKITDEKLKITLEKKLWLWQKAKQEKKKHIIRTWIYKNTSLYQTRNVKIFNK